MSPEPLSSRVSTSTAFEPLFDIGGPVAKELFGVEKLATKERGRFASFLQKRSKLARVYDAARVKYKGLQPVNFPGEAPLASVLATLPVASAPASAAAPTRRSGRAPAPKVIADAPDERAPSHKRQAKRPRETGMHVGKHVEGAKQKSNGKWRSNNFPGREFDDLDEYRAAKKQRAEQRATYSAQVNAWNPRR